MWGWQKWVSEYIYKVSHTLSHTFTYFHTMFTQFGLFLAILAQFQHVGCLKVCTWAGEFNDDAFTHFQWLLHALSHNFHVIWAILSNFGPISTCLVSKSKYLSWGIQWRYFHTLSQTPSCTFTLTQFGIFWAILAQFQHVMLGV